MPHQESLPTPPHYTSEQVTLIQEEVSKLLLKAGHTDHRTSLGEGLLLQHFSGTQERWGTKTCDQPQSTQQLCSSRAFQDGGHSHCEGLAGTGRLVNKSRPQGCVLCNSNTSSTSEIPPVSVPEEDLPFHMPPFRPLISSMGIHQNPEATSVHSTADGCPADRLHRRHTDHSRVQEPSPRTLASPSTSSRMPGIHYQHREVSTDSRPDHRVSGSHCRLHQYGATTTSYQDEADSSGVSTDNEDGRQNSQNPGTSSGQDELNSLRNSPAPLFYRNLQMALSNSLENHSQDYEGLVTLLPASLEELEWWDTEMSKWNGKTLLKRGIHMIIDSNESLQGWGVRCGEQTTGGAWSHQEAELHINFLELLAATLAVQSFAKDKCKIFILLRIDNTTAVAYINHLGGTVSKELVNLTKDLWMWCLEKNIHITAQHFPGAQNFIADAESRLQTDRTDWKLNPCIFHKIQRIFGPLEVDLFATRLSAQCQRYFSWRPDPSAEATDAFLQVWTHIKGYANPPWNLVGRTLTQVQTQRATIVLVAPIWKSQPWYPTLLHMLIDYPRLITTETEIMMNRDDSLMLPQLAVWHISGRDIEANSFQRKLQTSCLVPGELKQTSPTTHYLPNGIAGVLNGVQIPFLLL